MNNNNIKYEDLDFEVLPDKDFVKIKYNNKIIKITTPNLRCPFGIKEFKYNEEDLTRYSFSLSFDKIETNDENKKLYEFIKDLESHVNKYIKNKKNLYCQDIRKKIFKSFTSKLYVKDNYSPLFNLDIKNNTKIYLDDEDNKITYEELLEKDLNNSYMKCEIICNGIWINNKKFGISWKVNKIIIEDLPDYEDKYINFLF
jgi:hypothetical protein